MHSQSPLFKYESLFYPGLLVVNSIMKGVSLMNHEDSTVFVGAGLSLAVTALLFVLVALRKRVAFIITAVYLLLSGALGALSTLGSMTGDAPASLQILLGLFSVFSLFGGYRMVRLWQGMRPE